MLVLEQNAKVNVKMTDILCLDGILDRSKAIRTEQMLVAWNNCIAFDSMVLFDCQLLDESKTIKISEEN